MKDKRIRYIIGIVCIVIVCIGVGVVIDDRHQPQEAEKQQEKQTEIQQEVENNIAQALQKETEQPQAETMEEIAALKEEVGSNADSNLYQVAEEYDGKKTIVIKPSIQFQVALAGALKKAKPEEGEIEQRLKTISNKAGIWITEPSREAFKHMLEACDIKGFTINEKGYLEKEGTSIVEQNTLSQQLEQILQNGKTYIIDIAGTCYMRDDVSGEIIEYPFEQMDPYQICEPFTSGNYVLLAVTSNRQNQLSLLEIIQAILQY